MVPPTSPVKGSKTLTGASIATHCDSGTPTQVGHKVTHGPSPHIKPSAQVKEGLQFGWLVFGLSVVGSEAIAHETVAVTVLNENNHYRSDYEAMLHDIQTLSGTALRMKYRLEYNSHRNAKAAPKTRGIAFDSRLRQFRNFLRHMGPCPATDEEGVKNKRYTLR